MTRTLYVLQMLLIHNDGRACRGTGDSKPLRTLEFLQCAPLLLGCRGIELRLLQVSTLFTSQLVPGVQSVIFEDNVEAYSTALHLVHRHIEEGAVLHCQQRTMFLRIKLHMMLYCLYPDNIL